MKQTSVEWLYNNLKSHFEHDGDLLEIVQMSFNQAKEMEKEQIVDFGYDIADDLACGKYRDKKHMEERYNEYLTFKQQDK
jgi:hypothetical protein